MTKMIKHPLEDVFDMESGSMNVEHNYSMIEPPPSAMVPATAGTDQRDEDDEQIDKKIDAVYDAALSAFENQTAYTEIIEPRYAARNAEVAATYLNIALQAATNRARVKSDRKRAAVAQVPTANKTTNNIVIGNREEILRMITIDEEKKQIE